ncbi:MAG: relaxase/mobilization nuclease domain-containing protein [Flavobacteriales bacterium]
MLVKSWSNKSKYAYKVVLEYMFDDKRHKIEYLTKKYLRGKDISSWIKQYEFNESRRKIQRINGIKLHHELLSFSPKDSNSINSDLLKDIAKQYINYRNPKAVSVAVAHREKNHIHIHFCFSTTNFATGDSNRLSKEEFHMVKEQIQDYQIKHYPELSHSLVEHGKSIKRNKAYSLISEKEYQMTKRTGEISEKEDLYYKVQSAFHSSISLQNFVDTLIEMQIHPYVRRGKLTGVHFGKRKFRFRTLGISDEDIHQKEIDYRLLQEKEHRIKTK